jgi:hypothetical protein
MYLKSKYAHERPAVGAMERMLARTAVGQIPKIGKFMGMPHPDLESGSEHLRDCNTVFDISDRDLYADPRTADMSAEKFRGGCFRRQGACCEAICKNNLRCHSTAEFMLRVRYDSDPALGSCYPMPAGAVTEARMARITENERNKHMSTVMVCTTHHKTLTDALAKGAHWTFLRWAAYAGGVAVCALVIVPTAVMAVSGVISSAIAGTALAAAIPATVPVFGMPTIPAAVGAAAGLAGVWGPLSSRVKRLPGAVNEIAMAHKRAFEADDDNSDDDDDDDDDAPQAKRSRV